MEDKIRKFLKENKVTLDRESSTHFQMNCFLCTDTKGRLGIEKSSGKWGCFNCASNGKKFSTFQYAYKHKDNVIAKTDIEPDEREKKCTIKSDLHVKMHKRIFKTKKFKSAKYLIKQRGFSQETIKHFKLGARRRFKSEKSGKAYDAGEYIAIPYLVDGKCVNIKYRTLDPEEKKFKWRREKGGVSALFNDNVIDDFEYDEIFITESEIDCMSLWELGIKNVIGLTVGAKGFRRPWFDRLKRFKRIYLVLDTDMDGQEGAEKLAKRLGLGRCFNIVLPEDTKDPNDFIKKYKKEDLFELAKKAKKFEIQGAKTLHDMMNNLYSKKFLESKKEDTRLNLTTPWRRVNTVLGPMREGFLMVLAGKPKSGKTTIALNLMRYWAGGKDIPCGMYSCEMNAERLSEKFTMMEITTLENIEDAEPIHIKEAMYRLPMDKMAFYYPERKDLTGDMSAIEGVCERVKELVERYGLKAFIFDNLHFLCRGENEKSMVDVATQQFKLLAEELGILFICVTHPRKTNNNRQLKTDDLKGSSSIFQDADIVWLMHRPYNDGDMTPDEVKLGATEGSMSPKTEISITGRWTEGGNTFLAFNGATSTFKDKGIAFNKIVKDTLSKGRRSRRKGL